MIHIAITAAACHAICSTLPADQHVWPANRRDGPCLIDVEAAALDRLRAMRKLGERYPLDGNGGDVNLR
jgi:hypothetical protein